MGSAQEQSLTLAEMDPDLATEVLDEDVRETASFANMEREILLLLNKHKANSRSLHPPSSHPGGGSATTTSRSFKFEKRTLPKFGGTLREYPTFKKDWTVHVAPNYDEAAQLYELKSRVPARVRNRVEKFTTMEQFWAFMDGEFGDEDELVCDRLAYLRQYRHPKDAKTDAQKFWGMYERFHEVYADMEKVGSLAKLDHPASLEEFTKHLPSESL